MSRPVEVRRRDPEEVLLAAWDELLPVLDRLAGAHLPDAELPGFLGRLGALGMAVADVHLLLGRLRALVAEHPPDAVPVVGLGELARLLDRDT